MGRKKTVFVDLDDTVLEWTHAFHVYAKAFFPSAKNFDPRKEMDLLSWVRPEDGRGIISLIPSFNETDLFGDLEPVPGAKEALQTLKGEGFRLVALSSCGDSKQTQSLRVKPVDRHFSGLFDEIHVLPLETKKDAFIRKTGESLIFLLDDTPEQISAVSAVGGRTYFLDRNPLRRGRDHALRVARHTSGEIPDLVERLIRDSKES